MTSHWNVQLTIQEVREPEPVTDKNGYPAKLNAVGGVQMTERVAIERVRVNVVADTEDLALQKAMRLLDTEMSPVEEVTLMSGEGPVAKLSWPRPDNPQE